MSRQQQILAEIGIRPLWQLRNPAIVEALVEEAAAQPAPAQAASLEQPAPTPAAMPAPTAADVHPQETSQPAPPAVINISDWDDLHAQVAACQQCQLARTRSNTVVGRGNRQARLLIIGEAPGEQEDLQGLPFVGKAGHLLENMLAAAGFDSARDVYICNLLKCRPPGNRNPAQDEIVKCQRFLQWQIESVDPELIVAVGRFAAQSLLQSTASLGNLRGKQHQYGRYPVLVSFHPAYLLRSPGEKAKAWQDWCRVRQLLQK
ncbi:uracil-DNA glycosylase family protein [Vogesella sp. LIG4]|uniref:uracil-DNA glycosylase n=1 Tax=Vogesella sp. LIG4 TaxID=1192162 RepID=UPI00081F75DF|nr:uracil-DNA glycosylase [Vogesella sp. LIG4]SCK05662.1 DNA polymerase [Vogesella sp. LIG4]